MLGDTDAERDPSKGIVKKGHATTLHSPIRINTKFGDRISAILQESVADRVINHANPLLLLMFLLRPQHMRMTISQHVAKHILEYQCKVCVLNYCWILFSCVVLCFDATTMTLLSHTVMKFAA